MFTRAEKLVALAKMRQDWRNVNDCINDDLCEYHIEVRQGLDGKGSIITAQHALFMVENRHRRSVKMSAYALYWHKRYAFKRAQYEEVIEWGKQTLLDLQWLAKEIARLEIEVYYPCGK